MTISITKFRELSAMPSTVASQATQGYSPATYRGGKRPHVYVDEVARKSECRKGSEQLSKKSRTIAEINENASLSSLAATAINTGDFGKAFKCRMLFFFAIVMPCC